MKKDSQISMNFPAERRPRRISAVSRILRNFRTQQRKEYFKKYQLYKCDTFITLNGVQVF